MKRLLARVVCDLIGHRWVLPHYVHGPGAIHCLRCEAIT